MSTKAKSFPAVTVYGIPNCDTVKKSRHWLTEHHVDHVFHDFKKQGLEDATLNAWLGILGWELVLNRKGTSWRKLDEAVRDSVVDAKSAAAVIAQNLSLIKRPIAVFDAATGHQQVTVGYVPDQWQALLTR